MTAATALRILHEHGADVVLDGGNLRVRAPSPLPEAAVSVIRAEKAGLVSLLTSFPDLADRLDAYEERAAVLEFDARLTRSEAEHIAWNSVFGTHQQEKS